MGGAESKQRFKNPFKKVQKKQTVSLQKYQRVPSWKIKNIFLLLQVFGYAFYREIACDNLSHISRQHRQMLIEQFNAFINIIFEAHDIINIHDIQDLLRYTPDNPIFQSKINLDGFGLFELQILHDFIQQNNNNKVIDFHSLNYTSNSTNDSIRTSFGKVKNQEPLLFSFREIQIHNLNDLDLARKLAKSSKLRKLIYIEDELNQNYKSQQREYLKNKEDFCEAHELELQCSIESLKDIICELRPKSNGVLRIICKNLISKKELLNIEEIISNLNLELFRFELKIQRSSLTLLQEFSHIKFGKRQHIIDKDKGNFWHRTKQSLRSYFRLEAQSRQVFLEFSVIYKNFIDNINRGKENLSAFQQ